MTGAFTKSALVASAISLCAALLAIVIIELISTQRQVTAEYQRQAHTVGAAVLISSDEDDMSRVIARTPAGAEGRLAVHLPDGRSLGTSHADQAAVDMVAATRLRATVDDGETTYLTPVLLSDTEAAVIEVRIPGRLLSPGFGVRFGVLVLTGLAGMAIAATVACIRSKPISESTRILADTASTLEPSEQQIRVADNIPDDLVRLRGALVGIAQRWANLRTDERKVIADLSHRLRTPLTALRLDAEGLAADEISDRIRQSITALESEVSEVIRSSDAHAPAATRVCDLGAVVRDRMVFWSTLAASQSRSVDVDISPEPTTVALPENAVRGVMDALLVNVFRYTRQGTPFAVFVAKHANWITLVVDDGGSGIGDPGVALRRGSSGSGSTGLGLDIARQSAESIGGSVSIEQGALGGARVRLRLPEAGKDPSDAGPRAWRLWKRTRRAPAPDSPDSPLALSGSAEGHAHR